MSADVGLVMNAAQRDSCQLPIQTPGNGKCNRGLSHTWRPNQTKNLRGHGRSHLPDCKGFQDTLLHLLQAEMILIQNFSGSGYIHALLGSGIPGKLQNRIQVIAQDSALGGSKGLLFQTVKIL